MDPTTLIITGVANKAISEVADEFVGNKGPSEDTALLRGILSALHDLRDTREIDRTRGLSVVSLTLRTDGTGAIIDQTKTIVRGNFSIESIALSGDTQSWISVVSGSTRYRFRTNSAGTVSFDFPLVLSNGTDLSLEFAPSANPVSVQVWAHISGRYLG